MHRASNTVGAIAAALAKAQIELVNPEKSLTARLRTGGSQGPHRDFRYASLSSGLDIVRKTLGRHEIAMVQTTEVDAKANMVNLTTCWRILRGSGWHPIGRCARYQTRWRRIRWVRH